MSIVLYYGSGSPFAWRAQFALEHKALSYELKVLSFSAGEQRKPEFVALNPRHRVPTLVDGDFILYESNAIVEYLDEAYQGRGAPLFPGDARLRATVRRLVSEVDDYFDKALDPLTTQAFSKKPEERDPQTIATARKAIMDEFALFTRYLTGDFLVGPLSAADFAFYPLVAFVKRSELKLPDLGADGMLTPLPAPSIDTGMGLERITAVMQEKQSNYDTDLFMPLLRRIGEISGHEYGKGPERDISMRVVADHARSTTFLIADGVTPSNEWRGYVLRKIMRRAMRHGKHLGFTEPFLHMLVAVLDREMGDAYPDIRTNREDRKSTRLNSSH